MVKSVSTFERNIANIYGENGLKWLQRLPDAVAAMQKRFALTNLMHLENLSYNYVLSGLQHGAPIILKLSLDTDALKREARALKAFAGYGAVKVVSEAKGVLIIERAIPGHTLSKYFPAQDDEAISIACDIMKRLHSASISHAKVFPHIKDWLTALDENWYIPPDYLNKARTLRDTLLATHDHDVLLHGDLHHGNILRDEKGWKVIDPKGVWGDRAFEVACFIRNPIPSLLDLPNARDIIANRITRFADEFSMQEDRIKQWCFVEAVLSWIWALEDGCELYYFREITAVYYDIVK